MGLRKVNPYYFTFTTFTKGRWVGETILEVFSREFRAQPQHKEKVFIHTYIKSQLQLRLSIHAYQT